MSFYKGLRVFYLLIFQFFLLFSIRLLKVLLPVLEANLFLKDYIINSITIFIYLLKLAFWTKNNCNNVVT